MFKVECHGINGIVGDHSEWIDTQIACSFINKMWRHEWVTHFVVIGPDWKVIVRRRD